MITSTLEQIAMEQVPMRASDGAQYNASFGDLYWWGDPENLPALGSSVAVPTSKAGRRFLAAFEYYNGGMQRLGDPVETIEDGEVKALDFEPGTVLKCLSERLFRQDGFGGSHYRPVYASIQNELGFSIFQYRGPRMSVYARGAIWLAVSESRDGQRAFYPLEVDPEASYGASPEEKYSVVIKVSDTNTQSGMKQISLRQTNIISVDNSVLYERTRSISIYHPMYVPANNPLAPLFNGFRH